MMDGMTLVGLSDHLTKTTYADAKMRSQDAVQAEARFQDIFEGVALNDEVLNPLLETGA